MELASIEEAKGFSGEKMQKNNLFESPRMFCDLYCFEPGQEQKRHTHEASDKVYVVLEGKGRFLVGSEERELGVGKAILVSPGTEHGVVNPGPERLVILVFMAPKP